MSLTIWLIGFGIALLTLIFIYGIIFIIKLLLRIFRDVDCFKEDEM